MKWPLKLIKTFHVSMLHVSIILVILIFDSYYTMMFNFFASKSISGRKKDNHRSPRSRYSYEARSNVRIKYNKDM